MNNSIFVIIITMSLLEKIGIRLSVSLENIANRTFLFWDQHKVGILGTIIIHLVIFIVFLMNKLESNTEVYLSTVEVELKKDYEPPAEKKDGFGEGILPDDAVKSNKEVEAIRNFAVDATASDLNPTLGDDKGINASELYAETNRLREKLNENRELFEESKSTEGVDIPNTPQKVISEQEAGHYKGPAVISYFLKDRKAIFLPVPAYKCQYGGQVVVDIEVDGNGDVRKAAIDEANSVKDDCINQAAIKAANESTFTVSSSSSSRQKGSITYLFVPQ